MAPIVDSIPSPVNAGWDAPDPRTRVLGLAPPDQRPSTISIVDAAVWAPPLPGTAVVGIPAPVVASPVRASGRPALRPRIVATLAAIGGTLLALVGGTIALLALI